MAEEIDLKAAINAVSDVVQNRPRPIREFDQIYMKTGDMVMQSEFVANWARGKRLAFIGDGDSTSVSSQLSIASPITNVWKIYKQSSTIASTAFHCPSSMNASTPTRHGALATTGQA